MVLRMISHLQECESRHYHTLGLEIRIRIPHRPDFPYSNRFADSSDVHLQSLAKVQDHFLASFSKAILSSKVLDLKL